MSLLIGIGVIGGLLFAIWFGQMALSKGADAATRAIGRQIDKSNERDGTVPVTRRTRELEAEAQEARIEKQRRARLARQNKGEPQ